MSESASLEVVTREFVIVLSKKDVLVAELERLARRAKRIGAPAITWTFGEVVQREVSVRVASAEDQGPGAVTHRNSMVHFVHMTLTGRRPKILGWEFAATIQHIEDVNVLRPCPRGQELEIPEVYRTRGSVCDHCKLDRDRRDTYLVVSGAGEWKQVGSSCLVDFFGHENPHSIAASAEIFGSAMSLAGGCGEDEEGGWGFGGGGRGVWSLVEYLGNVAAEIREGGWVPKSAVPDNPEASTSGMAKDRMAPERGSPRRDRSVLDVDTVVATASYEWALSLQASGERLNDYLWNLFAVAKGGIVERRTLGIAASMVASYTKAEARKRELAARKPSEHVGEEGETRSFVLRLDRHFSFENQWGMVYRFIFRDSDDNVFTWKSSGDCSVIGAKGPNDRMIEGSTYILTARIKKHDEYKGAKQTVLTLAAVREHSDEVFQTMRDEEVRKVLGKKVRAGTASAEEQAQFKLLDGRARAASKLARAALAPFSYFETTVVAEVRPAGSKGYREVVDAGHGIRIEYDTNTKWNGAENPAINVRINGRWEGQYAGKDALDKARKVVAAHLAKVAAEPSARCA